MTRPATQTRFRGSDPLDHEANAWALLHVPFLPAAVKKRAHDYLFRGYWRPIHRLYSGFHEVGGIQTRQLVQGLFEEIKESGLDDDEHDRVTFRQFIKERSFQHIEAQDPDALGLDVALIETPRHEPPTAEAMLAFGPIPTLEFDADFAESLVNLAYADFELDCKQTGLQQWATAIHHFYVRPPTDAADLREAVAARMELRPEELDRLLYKARQAFRKFVVAEVRATLPPSQLHDPDALLAELASLKRASRVRTAVGEPGQTRRLDEDDEGPFFSG